MGCLIWVYFICKWLASPALNELILGKNPVIFEECTPKVTYDAKFVVNYVTFQIGRGNNLSRGEKLKYEGAQQFMLKNNHVKFENPGCYSRWVLQVLETLSNIT